MSIMMPSLQKARQLAKSSVCANNLKQMGTVWHLYANDNEACFPIGICWSYGKAWFHDKELTKYLPSASTWAGGADAQEVYKGYFCPENEKLSQVEVEDNMSGEFGQGYGTGYHINFFLGADAYTKVAKVNNQSNVPLLFDYYVKNDPPISSTGKPFYMGNYFSAAVEDSSGDYNYNREDWRSYYFMEGATEVHGSGGSNYLMVDSHVEKVKPMEYEEYGQKFTWDAKGAYVVLPHTSRASR